MSADELIDASKTGELTAAARSSELSCVDFKIFYRSAGCRLPAPATERSNSLHIVFIQQLPALDPPLHPCAQVQRRQQHQQQPAAQHVHLVRVHAPALAHRRRARARPGIVGRAAGRAGGAARRRGGRARAVRLDWRGQGAGGASAAAAAAVAASSSSRRSSSEPSNISSSTSSGTHTTPQRRPRCPPACPGTAPRPSRPAAPAAGPPSARAGTCRCGGGRGG